MKKERMYELLTELRDREFDCEEIWGLFACIHDYRHDKKQWIESVGTNLERTNKEYMDFSKNDLERQLDSLGLSDYTIDEFNTEDYDS